MALRVVSNYLRLPKKTFQIIDTLAYHAKSLYNVGLYNVRQHSATHRENRAILHGIRPDLTSGVEVLVGSYLPYTRKKDSPFKEYSTYVQSKENENYGLLHSDAAQQTLKSVEEAYKSYFELLALYRNGQLEYRPGSPKYLPKDGRFKLAFPRAHLAIRGRFVTLGMSHKFRKQHGLTGKELTFPIPPCIKPHQIREVTILPVNNGMAYKIEFCYRVPTQPHPLDPDQYLAIDLGLNNFATMVDTATGAAVILDGKRIKSINRWYNKENARLQSIKDKQGITCITKRQARFDDSHSEAYTSQVDALNLDPIRKPPYGRKRRVKRGLYQSALGTLINADVNGALNHARKVAGDSVVPRIIGSGRVNRPVRIRTTFEPSPFAQIKVQPCAPQGAPVASPLR
ncbi:RNA-guided endonuclease InsQ/TnpB family protein [Methanoculleus bourgensis]|uniref:Probable transposase IS891/IS1136/IS1341 domain-containing protein n=1 Tax=Methanoculleus bourgensis TaxID=83986 RepID=A0A0X3BK42_9EURY|nr:transposase [Methanoculleus bourgensis]CVK32260.1 protein of unknown function [Methanoculleus bourgensis]